MKNEIRLAEFEQAIRKGNRVVLAQAITLVESQRPDDVALANQLVEKLLPYSGKSVRLGITGVPGVGKSTFIESLGKRLTAQGKKLAVLAIDPTSYKTKGSILGDKTRMEELSRDPNAFIRPTATGTALGGVADRTREAILVCEAAGFDVIIIETVGVGQSEVAVRNLVDFFLLLMLAGAGDELQGIKKGIMEMADALVITKADGHNIQRAQQAQADYQHALHLLAESPSGWVPQVLTASAIEHTGIQETWNLVEKYVNHTKDNGFFEQNRIEQKRVWFREGIQQRIHQRLQQDQAVQDKIREYEQKILMNQILPARAAEEIIRVFFEG